MMSPVGTKGPVAKNTTYQFDLHCSNTMHQLIFSLTVDNLFQTFRYSYERHNLGTRSSSEHFCSILRGRSFSALTYVEKQVLFAYLLKQAFCLLNITFDKSARVARSFILVGLC